MITVDAKQLTDFLGSLKGMPEELDKSVKQGLTIAGSKVQSEARSLVPVDTSALRISIASDVRDNSVSVGPTQPYGKDIEFGRPPGTQVSPNALSAWAKRKGLNPYAVANAINKKGSPAQPYLFPAMEKQQKNVTDILSQAIINAFNVIFSSK